MKYRFLPLLLLLSMPVKAQDVADIPPGDDKIVAVRKGEPVPFTGQLFDQDTALRWGSWLKQYRLLMQAYEERSRKVCAVETGYRDSLIDVEKTRALLIEEDLKERLKNSETGRLAAEEELRNPPWYKSTTFVYSLGVLTTVAAVGVSYGVVNR